VGPVVFPALRKTLPLSTPYLFGQKVFLIVESIPWLIHTSPSKMIILQSNWNIVVFTPSLLILIRPSRTASPAKVHHYLGSHFRADASHQLSDYAF
jgi:hypothetical protein